MMRGVLLSTSMQGARAGLSNIWGIASNGGQLLGGVLLICQGDTRMVLGGTEGRHSSSSEWQWNSAQ